jgi:hypothetical protein
MDYLDDIAPPEDEFLDEEAPPPAPDEVGFLLLLTIPNENHQNFQTTKKTQLSTNRLF